MTMKFRCRQWTARARGRDKWTIHKGKRMSARPFNVLFLCTGNSARSIMAEALLNNVGQGKFRAYSAGSHPKGEVHPLALELMESNRLPAAGLRSKSWEELAQPQ